MIVPTFLFGDCVVGTLPAGSLTNPHYFWLWKKEKHFLSIHLNHLDFQNSLSIFGLMGKFMKQQIIIIVAHQLVSSFFFLYDFSIHLFHLFSFFSHFLLFSFFPLSKTIACILFYTFSFFQVLGLAFSFFFSFLASFILKKK